MNLLLIKQIQKAIEPLPYINAGGCGVFAYEVIKKYGGQAWMVWDRELHDDDKVLDFEEGPSHVFVEWKGVAAFDAYSTEESVGKYFWTYYETFTYVDWETGEEVQANDYGLVSLSFNDLQQMIETPELWSRDFNRVSDLCTIIQNL